jgi:hypothetical protein
MLSPRILGRSCALLCVQDVSVSNAEPASSAVPHRAAHALSLSLSLSLSLFSSRTPAVNLRPLWLQYHSQRLYLRLPWGRAAQGWVKGSRDRTFSSWRSGATTAVDHSALSPNSIGGCNFAQPTAWRPIRAALMTRPRRRYAALAISVGLTIARRFQDDRTINRIEVRAAKLSAPLRYWA